MIVVNRSIVIPERELREEFLRSSGPGGQNVNKVETAVQLRFDARNSPSLPEPVRERLRAVAGTKLTTEGVLVITARRRRTQEGNRRDARERLADLLREAASPPRARRPTKPTRGSARRRVDKKRQTGERKQQRRRVDDDRD